MNKKRWILFDFDGVIVDSIKFHIWATGEAAKKLDLPYDGDIFQKYFHWASLKTWTTNLLNDLWKIELYDEFIDIKKSTDISYPEHAYLFPDAKKFIQRVSQNYVCGIVTWSRRVLIDPFLETKWLVHYFDFVITTEDYTNWKPNPEPYILGLEKLLMTADEVIIIEDSPTWYMSAKNANIDCIVVRGNGDFAYEWCMQQVNVLDEVTVI